MPTMFVIGGSRGIGAAICRMAAGQGYDVALTYRANRAEADKVAADIRAAGREALRLYARQLPGALPRIPTRPRSPVLRQARARGASRSGAACCSTASSRSPERQTHPIRRQASPRAGSFQRRRNGLQGATRAFRTRGSLLCELPQTAGAVLRIHRLGRHGCAEPGLRGTLASIAACPTKWPSSRTSITIDPPW